MTKRILVADDSLTIQKVVNITLANKHFDLVECLSYEDLLLMVENNKYDLVLLDFNLSDDMSGYEVVKQIKDAYCRSKVMLMFGTFDTVDEDLITESGADDKIVKPFESSKFIEKCDALISGKSTVEKEEEVEEEDDNSWVVNSPEPRSVVEVEEEPIEETKSVDTLSSEIEDWGIEIPEVIGENTSLEAKKEVPPVIDDENLLTDNEKLDLNKAIDEDDGPELEDEELDIADRPTESLDIEEIYAKEDEAPAPTSQFISLDELAPEEDEEDEEEEIIDDETRDDLNAELDDELSAEDFWAADEAAEQNLEEEDEEDEIEFGGSVENLEHSDNEDNIEDEIFEDTQDIDTSGLSEEVHSTSLNVNIDELKASIINEIKDDLVGQITTNVVDQIKSEFFNDTQFNEHIKQSYSEDMKKIAWEVIPDLAENLIRNEIKEISSKVK
jgi:DNA-binding response OmpR family regulator